MADQGRSDFYVVYTMSLCVLELKQTLISLLFQIHTALKIDLHTLGSYLRLMCEYEPYILPNKKVSAAKDHDKNYMGDRPALVHRLLRNGLLPSLLFPMLSADFSTSQN